MARPGNRFVTEGVQPFQKGREEREREKVDAGDLEVNLFTAFFIILEKHWTGAAKRKKK